MIKNSTGEVADLPAVSQFEPNETESACGPFAVALCKYAGPPTKGPRGSAEDVDTYADTAYDKVFGSHDISVESGVVPDQIHQMLLDAGLHYQDLTGIADGSQQADDIRSIKAALDQGYLVIGEITETSVVDQEFGASPYYWNGTGLWHYVVYSGYTDTALLTHDGANINGTLNGVNTPRPQPRHYDAGQIQNRWCTIVWTDWLPRMPTNFNPTQTVINGGDTVLQQQLADTQAKLATLQVAWNKVVTEKNALIADKAALTQQVTDLQKQLAAATSNINVTLIQQQNTALQGKLQQIKALIG